MVIVYFILTKILFLGVLIGAQGKNVKTLRAATKCEISLVTSNYEGRAVKTKKYDTEPQVSTYFSSNEHCIFIGKHSEKATNFHLF